jgi:hypothetical protein
LSKKLKDRNQAGHQRKQAYAAVSIFYEMQGNKTGRDNALPLKKKNENISTQKSAEARRPYRLPRQRGF